MLQGWREEAPSWGSGGAACLVEGGPEERVHLASKRRTSFQKGLMSYFKELWVDPVNETKNLPLELEVGQ